MNRFQKFLHMLDKHETTGFWLYWLFLLQSFFGPVFKISWIEKKSRAKKVIKVKNQFCHACQPCRPVGRNFKLGWPFKCLFPPKVGVAHYTFYHISAKSWGGPGHPGHPGHPSTYGPVVLVEILPIANLEPDQWSFAIWAFYVVISSISKYVLWTILANASHLRFFFYFKKLYLSWCHKYSTTWVPNRFL